MFNALKYTEELEKAGFSREQAEASMRLLIEIMNENFATKADLKELELKMEYKLTIKLGTMMAVSIGLTATLMKIIPAIGN